ncbi:MAG: fibronectin type III domain-containing protein [Actinomycetes bacterium]
MRRVSVLTAAVVAAVAGFVTFATTAPAGASAPSVPDFIGVIAGSGVMGPPTTGTATSSPLHGPSGVAVDTSGNVYIADTVNSYVEKVTPAGILSIVAGTGSSGAPAAGTGTNSHLNRPRGVAVDTSGNVYIADTDNNRIEKVTQAGQLSIIAGTGTGGAPTAGTAMSSQLKTPYDVAVDTSGNLYIADTGNDVVEKVTSAGVLSIAAGTGTPGTPTAGAAAISSNLYNPVGVAVDPTGNVYISDYSNNYVEKVTTAGILSIIAGTGSVGSPIAGTATNSAFRYLGTVAVDTSGNVYIADIGNEMVEKVTSAGILSIIAGTGALGAPTPGIATNSALKTPSGVAVDLAGNVYIADTSNNMVEEVQGPSSTVPGAPTGVSASASAGYDSAIVSFVAPADFGGSPITSYTVAATDATSSANGGQTCAATDPTDTCTVVGLTGGDAYTFTVSATNDSGAGFVSAPSNSVTPSGLPGTASNVTATAGNTSALVSWAPSSANGTPVTGYTVTSSPDGLTCTATSTPCVVTGLTNGASYTFTVVASNTNGHSSPSDASNSVAPSLLPSAPTNVSATAGDTLATVSWTASVGNGLNVTGYTVSDGVGDTCTPTNLIVTSCTLTGLANGTNFTFTVVASNVNGNSWASVVSNSVTPSGVPSAPLNVRSVHHNGSIEVSWTAAPGNGSVITGYTVIDGVGDICTTTTATQCTVSGLINGTAYAFSVTATNTNGTGVAASAPTATPSTTPGPVTNITSSPGPLSATISWTYPSDSGGAAITGGTATAVSNGNPKRCSATAPASTCTITGLKGVSYNISVVASNVDGNSTPTTGPSVVPTAPPGAPLNPVATAGDGQVAVSWTAPVSDHGSTITGYTVTSSTGGTAGRTCTATTTLSCVVTGLSDGVTYNFTVTASNAAGTGVPSVASNSVEVVSSPGAPLNPVATAGDGQVAVSWTAPVSDHGSTITGYTVTSSTGGTAGRTCTATTTLSCVVTGLSDGVIYTFTVTASNAVGTGLPSVASNSVEPSSNNATITSANSTTIAGGKGLKFLVTTSPPGTATVSQTGKASWMTLTLGARSKTGTAVVSGISPTGGGTFTVTIHANNGVGPDTIQVLTVHVLAFTSIATASFHMGVSGSFVITTSDSAATLSATLSTRKEAGLTFTNNADGTATISGRAISPAKTANVTVTATIGSLKVKQTLTVSIN